MALYQTLAQDIVATTIFHFTSDKEKEGDVEIQVACLIAYSILLKKPAHGIVQSTFKMSLPISYSSLETPHRHFCGCALPILWVILYLFKLIVNYPGSVLLRLST
jgi:hypothetical protein